MATARALAACACAIDPSTHACVSVHVPPSRKHRVRRHPPFAAAVQLWRSRHGPKAREVSHALCLRVRSPVSSPRQN